MASEPTPEILVKPLKGKYDRRKGNGARLAKWNREHKGGRKPNGRKEILGGKAVTYLREMDAVRTPSQMFADAIEAKSYSLAWEIRRDCEARALGRPYVAVNPEEKQRHDEQDVGRIAVAIRNLQIVAAPEPPALKKNSQKELAAGSRQLTVDARPVEPVTE